MHVSLDGFAAGPQGEMDWINMDEELFAHVGKRIALTDTALYGRLTYQLMESYWPTAADKPNASQHDKNHARWYSKARKLVLSNSLSGEGLENTTVLRGPLQESIQAIKQSTPGEQDEILLFGSPGATHALMKENLIDGYWLFVNPIVLGQGIPLFTEHMSTCKLKLLNTHTFNSGVVELNYIKEKLCTPATHS